MKHRLVWYIVVGGYFTMWAQQTDCNPMYVNNVYYDCQYTGNSSMTPDNLAMIEFKHHRKQNKNITHIYTNDFVTAKIYEILSNKKLHIPDKQAFDLKDFKIYIDKKRIPKKYVYGELLPIVNTRSSQNMQIQLKGKQIRITQNGD